jgi:hypothetical protein
MKDDPQRIVAEWIELLCLKKKLVRAHVSRFCASHWEVARAVQGEAVIND